ncbi:MAG: transcription antitermination protein NusB, partial [Deltaproteobacteria bacterium]|nr:transcription antitermination protein NusB [Deltaproteobacteria bacterium]
MPRGAMSTAKKTPRRLERVLAFKVLYGLCFSPEESEQGLLRSLALSPELPKGLGDNLEETFAWRLIRGVWENRAALDRRIG